MIERADTPPSQADYDDVIEQVFSLSSQVMALRIALREYGQHTGNCRARRECKQWQTPKMSHCNCGLALALGERIER